MTDEYFKVIEMLETLSLVHCVTFLQPFSKLARDQQVSAYNRSFITMFKIHGSKEIIFSLLHAQKVADEVFLYVFIIGFSASPLADPAKSGAALHSTSLL